MSSNNVTPIRSGMAETAIPGLDIGNLHLTLTEAYALSDTVYTAHCAGNVEELCEHTASTVLHVAMQKLEHALEMLKPTERTGT